MQEVLVEMLTNLVTSEIPVKPSWNGLSWLDTVSCEFELKLVSERLELTRISPIKHVIKSLLFMPPHFNLQKNLNQACPC